jgi:phosphoribosylanthranilate isomerase
MEFGVKICGLKTQALIDAAVTARADMIGLVMFPKSPRHVDLHEASALARHCRSSSLGQTKVVVLLVDPDDTLVQAVSTTVAPDFIQLHGHETVTRVREVKALSGLPILKAVPIATTSDLAAARPYADDASMLVFDAKPPKGAALTGGNGVAFDWHILADHSAPRPFMLSGGLTPANVGQAIRIAKPNVVDVSSGVETAPGVKSASLICEFVANARRANAVS